jgi:hypothetical protein
MNGLQRVLVTHGDKLLGEGHFGFSELGRRGRGWSLRRGWGGCGWRRSCRDLWFLSLSGRGANAAGKQQKGGQGGREDKPGIVEGSILFAHQTSHSGKFGPVITFELG